MALKSNCTIILDLNNIWFMLEGKISFRVKTDIGMRQQYSWREDVGLTLKRPVIR